MKWLLNGLLFVAGFGGCCWAHYDFYHREYPYCTHKYTEPAVMWLEGGELVGRPRVYYLVVEVADGNREIRIVSRDDYNRATAGRKLP